MLCYTASSWIQKPGTVQCKHSTKVRVCIPTAQSSINVNAKYLLNKYIWGKEMWAQKMKGKGGRKKAGRQKNDISTDISFHKNL